MLIFQKFSWLMFHGIINLCLLGLSRTTCGADIKILIKTICLIFVRIYFFNELVIWFDIVGFKLIEKCTIIAIKAEI